jgi:hypothetical protein
MTLTAIVERFRETEEKLKAISNVEVNDVVFDAFEIVAHTLRHEHSLSFRRPKKAKIEESSIFLRDCFKNDKILIHESCTGLITQLKNAIWKDNRKDVERSEEVGHADAIFALIYALRVVTWGRKALDASPSKVLKFGSVSKSVRRRF